MPRLSHFVCHGSTCPLNQVDVRNKKVYAVQDPMGSKGSTEKKLFFLDTCFLITHPTLKGEMIDFD